MTKAQRQAEILRLVSERKISTQEELLDSLRAGGVETTQATVSRDMRELRLVKASGASGAWYVQSDDGSEDRNGVLLSRSVISCASSGNICCVNCHSGAASVAAAALDANKPVGVVGTLAGDDTV
ncbi:MAG: arginine repressor, partial [Clostridia bacterium]|nr:arginine repressor [Clostridia bacterium]